MEPHALNMVGHACDAALMQPQAGDDPEPIALDGEWENIEDQLHVCLKSIRGLYPQMYRQHLDTEGVTSDEGKTKQIANDRRRQAIETMTTRVVSGLQDSFALYSVRADLRSPLVPGRLTDLSICWTLKSSTNDNIRKIHTNKSRCVCVFLGGAEAPATQLQRA